MNESTTTAQAAEQEVSVLRNGMLFSLTRHTWSNRRKADKALVNTTADKRKLNLTKQLLESPELDALNSHLNGIYDWCLARAMPSTAIRRGIYFVKRDVVPEFEERLSSSRAELRDRFVPEFLATYAERREAMKAADKLGDLYADGDYPEPETLRGMFSVEWTWLALSVPGELPEEVRLREVGKLRDSFLRAQEEIKYALRTGFKELVQHAVDRLTVRPGERPKMFRDSLVSNFKAFIDTFDARNLMDDAELAALVGAARDVVSGLPRDMDTLRGSDGVRASAAAQFAALSERMDSLVIEQPSRRFDMEA